MSLFQIHGLLRQAEKACLDNIVACCRDDIVLQDMRTAKEFVGLLDEIVNALNYIDHSEYWMHE